MELPEDGDKLRLGLRKLVMGFTADGQANPEMIKRRDQDLGTSAKKKTAQRADIPAREIAPGADAWQKGDAFQISDDLAKGSATERTQGTNAPTK